jgi:predicted  nucleic acid-binding Zn-ribbon protein
LYQNQDHIKLTQLQQAMDEATKALSSQEADVAVLAEEKQALQTRLKEEKSRLDMQQQSRDKMRSELEETKAREVGLYYFFYVGCFSFLVTQIFVRF